MQSAEENTNNMIDGKEKVKGYSLMDGKVAYLSMILCNWWKKRSTRRVFDRNSSLVMHTLQHWKSAPQNPFYWVLHFKCSSYNLVFQFKCKVNSTNARFSSKMQKVKYLDFYATSTQTKEMQDFHQKCKMLNIWFLSYINSDKRNARFSSKKQNFKYLLFL